MVCSDRDADGRAPIHKAVLAMHDNANTACLKVRTALSMRQAARSQCIGCVTSDSRSLRCQRCGHQRVTPLHLAARIESVAAVQFLLDSGARHDLLDHDGTAVCAAQGFVCDSAFVVLFVVA